MFSALSLALIASLYVLGLFVIAWWGDRRRDRTAPRPFTYALSIGVYATSWTFFGGVGRASDAGWEFVPIYLGPILVFLFATPVLRKILTVAKAQNIVTIADFIAARYGRDARLAALVTLIAVLGSVPYIALQLKAVAMSFEVLSDSSAGSDTALYIAMLMALFAVLFGTRHVDSTEKHQGMVQAVAFESVIKLTAFLGVGAFVSFIVFANPVEMVRQSSSHVLTQPFELTPVLITQTLLAMLAALCLPRQFHITVVENTAVSDLKTARWLFPLYLFVAALFVAPIAMSGDLLFAGQGVDPDTYVLALPMAQSQTWLALFVFVGGFSAATAMVIVATVALSTMVSNDLILPLALKRSWFKVHDRNHVPALLTNIRRTTILGLMLVAYGYYRLSGSVESLSAIGLLAFAAAAQLAPSLLAAIYWRRGTARGAKAGLLTGFALWVYTLLVPTFAHAGFFSLSGIPALLNPEALLGLSGFDTLTHGVVWSLGANAAVFYLVSLVSRERVAERLQATEFVSPFETRSPSMRGGISAADLRLLIERFMGTDRALDEFDAAHALNGAAKADAHLIEATERILSGAIGASSARIVMDSALMGRSVEMREVAELVEEASQALAFSRELLESTINHLDQAISVVDKDMRLVAWNEQYVRLFDYPPDLIEVGRPIGDLIRANVERGLLQGTADDEVERRLAHMRAGSPYVHQRQFADGRVFEMRGNPMPGGGFVTSFTDITVYREAERALQRTNVELEMMVAERTRALESAKSEADLANRSKTRFLAAATHDLLQPLNAARLFSAALAEDTDSAGKRETLTHIDASLVSAEDMLNALLDISKLEAGAMPTEIAAVPLAPMFEALAREFGVMAEQAGLTLTIRPTTLAVTSDAKLLRRVVQNLVSNAIRYTETGKILVGARRRGDAVVIEVWDTGIGIPAAKQMTIFEEFQRLGATDRQGRKSVGLGLATVDHIVRVLGHTIALCSVPGRGSRFQLSLPHTQAAKVAPVDAEHRIQAGSSETAGAVVLCLDNDTQVLDAMRALLHRWGCIVLSAATPAEALSLVAQSDRLDLILADHQLDDGVTGFDALAQLNAAQGGLPPVIMITADHSEAVADRAHAEGFGLLTKPVRPAALRALIRQKLRQSL